MPTTRPTTGADADAAARALARWLAPYLAVELRNLKPTAADEEGLGYDERYDRRACRLFVAGLGDGVLENAQAFFGLLVRDGQVGSLALSNVLAVGSPRNISSVLTTPLKRRAKALGLPYPWEEGASADSRTIWLDPTGACKRILEAIHRELETREQRSPR